MKRTERHSAFVVENRRAIPIAAANRQEVLSSSCFQTEGFVGNNAIRIMTSTDRARSGWLVCQTLVDGPGQLRTVEFIVGDPDPRRCEEMVRASGTGVCPEDLVRAVRRLSGRELSRE